MRLTRKTLSLLAGTLSVAVLCGCTAADYVFKPLKEKFGGGEPAANAEFPNSSKKKDKTKDMSYIGQYANNGKNPALPPERDPVQPMEKGQIGMHYDPDAFDQGAYRPDELKNMLSSKGFDGLVQQTFAEAGGDFHIDVDHTGKYMVFATTRYSQNPDICIQGVSGHAVTQFTNDAASDMMPKFSPDSQQIAWCSNRYGNWDILQSPFNNTPNTRPRQLTNSTDDEIHPTWSPDGKMLAYSRFSSMDRVWRIWVLDMQTRAISSVTEGLFPEFRPVPETVSGKPAFTLVYQKHRQRDIPWYSIWTIRINTNGEGKVEVASSPTEVIASDKWAAINPCWNPAGNYLAFASVRKSPLSMVEARIYKADDVWVINIDGTDLTQITSHAAPEWDPCWAVEEGNPYGRLYFDSLQTGHENIWSVKPVIIGLMADSTK